MKKVVLFWAPFFLSAICSAADAHVFAADDERSERVVSIENLFPALVSECIVLKKKT